MKNFVMQNIKWFGQYSLQINVNGLTVFIDPFNLPENYNQKADLVLITHSHFDHLSFDDLQKVVRENTYIYAPSDAYEKLKNKGYKNLVKVEPQMEFTFKNLKFETVPMYNIVKTQYHPKENKWNGYVLTIDNKRIYIAGDTERIPEMKNINADIVFMTLGQVYTMNSVQEAVEAVLDTKASLAIPVHYGMYEGTEDDAKKFSELLQKQGVQTIILDKLGKK